MTPFIVYFVLTALTLLWVRFRMRRLTARVEEAVASMTRASESVDKSLGILSGMKDLLQELTELTHK